MLDPTYIRDSLRRLARAMPNVFGAGEHEFKLNPPRSEAEVTAFEAKHGIRLPGDYRQFIAEIGNGGAGPYYGVSQLGHRLGIGSCFFDHPMTRSPDHQIPTASGATAAPKTPAYRRY